MSEENGYTDPDDRIGRSDKTDDNLAPLAVTSKGWGSLIELYMRKDDALTGRPPPLIASDVDLKNLPYMPLDVARLRDSGMANHPNPEVFRSAVLLWCASWHQVPAASLPNDDVELARYAGFGRDHQGWLAIREEALRGFIECSDGRLYHKVVAEKALISFNKRESFKERTKKARAAKGSNTPVKDAVTETVTEPVTSLNCNGKGIYKKKDSVLRTDAVASPQPTYTDSRHELWGEGVPILCSLGVSESQSRSMIGKWLKGMKDDAQAVLGMIQKARDLRVQNPVPWITQGLQYGGSNVRSRPGVSDPHRQGAGKPNGITKAIDTLIERFEQQACDEREIREADPGMLPGRGRERP